MAEMDILNIYEYVVTKKPKVVVVDSIQTLYNSTMDSISGTPTQIRECTLKIIEMAKKYEIAVFSMEENGMKEIKNSSEYFLSEREEKNIGSMVVPILEGTKVFLLEIQSLIVDSGIGIPRRVVQGYDKNRIQILTAIAERKLNVPLGTKDLFVNVPGGLSIEDPAADLGVLISILSVSRGFAISQKIAAIGELGLRGEIRKVFFVDKRLKELEKLGFLGVYVPESNRKEIEKKKYKLKIIYLKTLDDLLERMKKND